METMLIGIPDMGPDPFRIYMFGKYAAGVRWAGGEVEKLPWGVDDDNLRLIVENWDGLLLPGGPDMDPAIYGEAKEPACGEINAHRDDLEMRLLRIFLETGKPILGICRGMQLINVALGGTLIQDLPPEQKIFHTSSQGDLVHPVFSPEGSTLNGLYGPVFSVNSAHHQALDQLSDGLEAVAWSESGVVEAVELPGYPLLGVQFHPERMAFGKRRLDTVDGAAIFGWFLDVCRESAAFSQPT